jgi:hypothetical protein
MTPNKRTVESYMDGFRKTDRPQILSCLTDDVEWVIPGAFHVRGKDDFAKHIVDEGFVGHPVITVSRLTEEDNVVVAEGAVRAPKAGWKLSEPGLLRCIRQAGREDSAVGQLSHGDEMTADRARYARGPAWRIVSR